jgi:hypothetical protein
LRRQQAERERRQIMLVRKAMAIIRATVDGDPYLGCIVRS